MAPCPSWEMWGLLISLKDPYPTDYTRWSIDPTLFLRHGKDGRKGPPSLTISFDALTLLSHNSAKDKDTPPSHNPPSCNTQMPLLYPTLHQHLAPPLAPWRWTIPISRVKPHKTTCASDVANLDTLQGTAPPDEHSNFVSPRPPQK